MAIIMSPGCYYDGSRRKPKLYTPPRTVSKFAAAMHALRGARPFTPAQVASIRRALGEGIK